MIINCGGALNLKNVQKYTYFIHSKLNCRSASWWKAKEFGSVASSLKFFYKNDLKPLEEVSLFNEIVKPPLYDADFDAKPMILVLGQYSTGKTTFIRHLLDHDFPGMRIGPEPTTDRFIAVMHGPKVNTIPGYALVGDKTKPFEPLSHFGNAFLTKFQCSTLPLPMLENISIIDSPGILSGEKQRVDRGYDFSAVLRWFSERVDRIILLFDANKLDISDEFRYSLKSLKGKEEKFRILLNKADGLDSRSLVRVYGALMWSLGRIWETPEVAKVYIGSFWDKAIANPDHQRLFEEESKELFEDLQQLPENTSLRKISDFGQRVRDVTAHAYIMGAIKDAMPMLLGRDAKKKVIIEKLGELFSELQVKYQIPPGDFPAVATMQKKLVEIDFSKLSTISPRTIARTTSKLSEDLYQLMELVPSDPRGQVLRGKPFDQLNSSTSPL